MHFPRAALVMFMLSPLPAVACSSCGCTLSSDWVSQGISTGTGFSADLRYDYIDQSALHNGTGSATAPAVPGSDEVEQRSTNRYVTATLGYNAGKTFGVSVLLPWLDRSHSTIAPGDTDESLSHTHSLADIKVVARYQGFSDDADTGVLFGLKLPTGGTSYAFNGGPQAGERLDRSLQPGTGSTDLIVGAFRFGSLNRDWDWYAQALFQTPLRIKDDFRSGSITTLNGGFRYMGLGAVVPQLQVNALDRRRDGGLNADPDNSGGDMLYVSPGVNVAAAKGLDVYGFVQVPVYQRVNGLQLVPRWNTSVGVSYRFN